MFVNIKKFGITPLVFLAVLFIFFYLPKLGTSYTQPTDPVWTQRGVQFYEAFRHGDFAQTYTKYHPGVTLMWITGVSYKLSYAFQRVHFGYVRDLFEEAPYVYSDYSFIAKLLIELTIIAVLLYCFFVIKRRINAQLAFWVMFFVLAEPFVIGNIRSIHVDALASFFMFGAVVAFWASGFEKKILNKHLLLCGIFTGLALLTKINSLILFPFFLAVWVFRCLSVILGSPLGATPESEVKRGSGVDSGRASLARMTNIPIIIFLSFLTFFFLFPSMWVHPLGTVQKIISDGFLDTALGEGSSRIVFLGWDELSFRYKYFSYLVQLLYRTSPVFLIFGVLGFFSFVTRYFVILGRSETTTPESTPEPLLTSDSGLTSLARMTEKSKSLLMYSAIFLLGYYLMISISDKKIFRYILPMYPFMAVFVGYGVTVFLEWVHVLFCSCDTCVANWFSKIWRRLAGHAPQLHKTVSVLVVFLIVSLQLSQPLSIFPNFFAYFNPLLGGIKGASRVISLNQDATGYYEVAQYLNKKPNAQGITLACYDSGPMDTYFVGHSLKLKLFDGQSDRPFLNTDYVLLSIQEGWNFVPEGKYTLERTFKINSVDYWFLLKRVL